MAEQIDLTVPLVADPRSTRFVQIRRKDYDERVQRFLIVLGGQNNFRIEVSYSGQEAIQFRRELNRPHPTKSEDRRIFERLIADGKFNGTISGSPD